MYSARFEAEPSLKNAYRVLHPIIETDLDSYPSLALLRHTTKLKRFQLRCQQLNQPSNAGGARLLASSASGIWSNVGVGESTKRPSDYARIYHTVERTDPKYTTKLPWSFLCIRPEKFMRPSTPICCGDGSIVLETEDSPYGKPQAVYLERALFYTGEIKTEAFWSYGWSFREF